MNAVAHCEVALPGFEGCAPKATTREKSITAFYRKAQRVKLSITDLTRDWLRLKCPPCPAGFESVLPRFAAHEPPHPQTVEMTKLVTAMMEAGQKTAAKKMKLWKFPELHALIEENQLFPQIRDEELSGPAFSSTVGKLLTGYKGTPFQIGAERIVFQLKGRHRARKYFLQDML